MIKARCYRCGSILPLTEQLIANALAVQGIEGKPSHYSAECPHCRHVNKVSLRGVRLPEPERRVGQAGDEVEP